MSARTGLFVALGLITAAFVIVLARALQQRAAAGEQVRPTWQMTLVSFIANFWDTLGIGSFATTTSMVRQWHLVPDQLIPGTLNVGYVLPTVVEAYIYTRLIPVDPTTLISLIAASAVGAWLGAGVVSSWSRHRVRIGLGLALITMATIMLLSQPQIGLLPAGGDAHGLTGLKLIAGIGGNFVLGALMTVGVGLYAPCMILVFLLGMNLTTAFPIMMGSCAFLMPAASIRFVRTGSYSVKSMLGMIIGGVPAVLIAAFIVKSLPLDKVKWLVIAVVAYTAINLLRAARKEHLAGAPSVAAEPA